MADAAKMQISDEVAIQITGMNKWYGQSMERQMSATSAVITCMPGTHFASASTKSITRLLTGNR